MDLKVKKKLWNTTRQSNCQMVVKGLVYVYQFLTYLFEKKNIKSSKFPTSRNFSNPSRKTIYTPIYPKITQKINKTARNVDKWDKQRHFWLLETWTRYLIHNTQPKYGLKVYPPHLLKLKEGHFFNHDRVFVLLFLSSYFTIEFTIISFCAEFRMIYLIFY